MHTLPIRYSVQPGAVRSAVKLHVRDEMIRTVIGWEDSTRNPDELVDDLLDIIKREAMADRGHCQ